MGESFRLRAFDAAGTRELAGAREVALPDERDEQLAAVLAERAAQAVGAPVALLGQDGPEVLCVEVLDAAAHPWVDAELPDGWRRRAPWRQPGWYAATVERIDAELAGAGLRRTGDVVQTKHWSISALMRVPTDAGDVWFKQVPPMFAHEGRLVAWLAQLAPELIAPPVAVGDDWWLAADLGAPREVPAGAELGAIDLLAGLQRRAAGRDAELLALGCPDRRLETLLPAVVGVLDRDDVLEAGVRAQVRERLPALAAAVDQLSATGVPDSLVHGDFHSGNQRFTERGWVIYDWTDGCLSNPLVDLAPGGFRAEGRAERLAATHRHFPELSEHDVLCGLIVGAAHQVVTYQRIADGVEPGSAAMWGGEGTACAEALVSLLS